MNALPDELKFLRPALSELSELPANELNEDVDLTSVETALRERIKGLSIREAIERIKHDCQALKKWSKESGKPEPATSFVIGVLSYRPGPLARRLLAACVTGFLQSAVWPVQRVGAWVGEVLSEPRQWSYNPGRRQTPHPNPLPIEWGEGDRWAGELPSIKVVMISKGEPKENRAKVKEHGLTFPIVLQQQWDISRR